jgi:hypothetical protein
MNQECISEEMSSKGEMTKETMHNGYKITLHLFACMDKDLENHFVLI